MKKMFLLPILMIFFIILLQVVPYEMTASAQTVTSNCWIIKVGNPAANQALPAGCSASAHWPFGIKSKTMIERVDQGFDLEFDTSPATVYAVEDGTINLDHGSDPCNGGTGFGNTYPLEVLNTPITVNGRTYHEIYYGHVQYTKLGPVKAGDPIAVTYDCVNEGAGFVPWLEIGFWGPGGPIGQPPYITCPLDPASGVATTAGCDMKKWLMSVSQ